MALNVKIIPHVLQFKFQANTSRGSLDTHKTWYLKVWDSAYPEVVGIGECAPFEGLSVDDVPNFQERLETESEKIIGNKLPDFIDGINQLVESIDIELPSARFGFEIALRDLFYGGVRTIFDSGFITQNKPIPINGLVWMGDKHQMLKRLEEKISEGFDTIKIKIGAINWHDELELIRTIRERESGEELTIRVDANGAFSADEIGEVLHELNKLNVHSIEQPVKAGKIDLMRGICSSSPVPIALDEELIGINGISKKRALLETIKPQFIVLKPTLLGGFTSTEEWISLAEELDIGWWITSALESNIGLNAICQFTSLFDNSLPQGLGTGGLYGNNISSPLTINRGEIFIDSSKYWDLQLLN